MKLQTNTKKGSVIALCLVFATVLLLMGLGYSKMTSDAKKQTVQIDDRIRVEYIANGLTELALLKFQLFPADYYACMEAAKKGNKTYIETFAQNEPQFSIVGDVRSSSSYDRRPYTVRLATMTVLTDEKWKKEVLLIKALAQYRKSDGGIQSKLVTRVVELSRDTCGF